MASFGKLVASTAMKMFTSMMTEKMLEWCFWWLAEKLVSASDPTWDDELLGRMKAEREASKGETDAPS